MTIDPTSLALRIAERERELDALRRELSRWRTPARLPDGLFGVLRCSVGPYAIGLLTREIDEVLPMAALTLVPSAPPWMLGLLVLGERRVPVMDLLARESGTQRVLDPGEFLVVTTTENGSCALVVERLEGLCELDSADVHRPSLDIPFGAHVLGIAAASDPPFVLISTAPLSLRELAAEVHT